MSTEIVNPKEYGIREEKANDLIGDMLPQLKEERKELETQYKEVIKLDVENPESWEKARELRLLIQKNRTKGINVWHRNEKYFFLKGGQFIDAIKRKEIAVNKRMEDNLIEIEKYEEIQRQKEIKQLNEKRSKELEPYAEFVPLNINLGELSEEDYKKTFNGAKMQFESEQERIKKEEEERQERERIENLHSERKEKLLDVWQFVELKQGNFGEISEEEFNQLKVNAEAAKEDYEKEQERIRKENERLEKERKEAEEKERKRFAKKKAEKEKREERSESLRPYLAFINDYDQVIELSDAKFEKELKYLDSKKKEQDKKERKRKEQERKEREKREALEAKIKAEKKANRKRLEKEKAEAERLRKAPIKKQMNVWIDSFELPEIDIENPEKNVISKKFESFKDWSKKQVENL